MFGEEGIKGGEVVDFLVPHVPNEGFEGGVVAEDPVLAGVDEVCAEFASLVDAELVQVG